MSDKGLDHDGYIAREGSLSRVPPEFAPLVASARARIADAFGDARLHSAYLYGSVPRGTAIPGVSDLDLLLALHGDPTDADRADARALEAALNDDFAEVDGVSALLFSTDTLLSELERYDMGWMVACLCTPLLGDDLAARLPRYRPSSVLARESNGDLGPSLDRWRGRAAALAAATEGSAGDSRGRDSESRGSESRKSEGRTLNRAASRRIVRTGLSLVMPRWGGWTSDLTESAEVFGRYYPERAAQMRRAATIARTRTADTSDLNMLLDDLGPWLAAEYTAVHGRKTPRGETE